MKKVICITLMAASVLAAAVFFRRPVQPSIASSNVRLVVSSQAKSDRLEVPSVSTRAAAQLKQNEVTLLGVPANATGSQIAEHLHFLGSNLTKQEQSMLAAWITGPKPTALRPNVWLYLVNEVMNKLCEQSHPLATLSDLFVFISRQKNASPGIRDYAIQHMTEWVQPMTDTEPHEVDSRKREAMVSAMLDAIGDSQNDFAGTALQGLNQILRNYENQNRSEERFTQPTLSLNVEQLHQSAVNLSLNAKATDAARITAFQVCAQRGFPEVLTAAREIAKDPSKSYSLRMSAIAAVGQLGGGADDMELLSNLQRQRNPRLNESLLLAINRVGIHYSNDVNKTYSKP